MKRILTAAMFAITMIASAFGADVYDKRLEQTADVPGHGYFQGLSVGVQAGGQFSAIDIDASPAFSFDGISSDGVIGGINGEYLFSSGAIRFGPYVEGGWSNVNTEIGVGGTKFDVLKQNYYVNGGLKAGVALDRALIFGRVGYERAFWEASNGSSSVDVDADSLVFGGGIDYMIGANASLGVGLDYLWLDNVDVDGSSVNLTPFLDDSEAFRGMVRLNWRQ
jgi:opacity protein-like surface antigen